MTRNDRWILSEWLVANDRCARFGETLLYHQQETPFAEIDLITSSRTRDGTLAHVIEVKTVGDELWSPHVISRRQIARLERARQYIEGAVRARTALMLATVRLRGDGETEINYFQAPFQ